MPDYQVSISTRASAELDAIHAYIAGDSPINADGMAAKILAAIDSLEIFPHRTVLQRQRSNWPHRVRSLAVRPYVNFFWIVEDQKLVYILTIRHGARRRPFQITEH